ncbi:MAG: cytochrome-c peroxidase [Brumimicrobium sp.]|nr:cytochrome-c peroxidase [Brumimicrobium sp.]
MFSYGCKKDKIEQVEKYNPTPVKVSYPSNFPTMIIPADNPMTKEGIALGRRLFYDPILSGDNTVSCASCHQQGHSFGDPNQFSFGVGGQTGDVQSPTLINLAWQDAFFWNGRAKSIEEQVFGPVTNPVEMNSKWSDVITKLKSDASYRKAFKQAFGTENIDSTHVAKAIAQFERTFISGNSKYDKWLRGETNFTNDELEGYYLFFSERGDCFHCHGTILAHDNSFHNNGLDLNPDPGLFNTTGNPNDFGKFKTSSLRNIELSAPYMHDGRFQTLAQVLMFYSTGIHKDSPNLSPLMESAANGGVQLDAQEMQYLLAFLKTFTDQEFIQNTSFSQP